MNRFHSSQIRVFQLIYFIIIILPNQKDTQNKEKGAN